jgi:arabinan endo-1,5-alpha-L-arabinosidase
MNQPNFIVVCLIVFSSCVAALSQTPRPTPLPFGTHRLENFRMRDPNILVDEKTKTYYIVSSAYAPATTGYDGAAIRVFTSKDLIEWEGPRIIFQTPSDLWGDVKITGIWAPEMQYYKGKYYLFATFNTEYKLSEQWRDWLPRVRRATQILVGDSPLGPFKPFANRPTLPADMMTLDGTLYEEDGVPYIVFAHEWVQITDGTIEYARLKDDLSDIVGEPKRLFRGSDAPWARKSPEWGCWVTDGPDFYRSKSGKLFMIWSSFSETGYTTGVAVSDSGKLAGPWKQRSEPLYSADGGHGTIFKRFDGTLMLVLHSPNKATERAKLFEIEDTGETLRVIKPFTSEPKK